MALANFDAPLKRFFDAAGRRRVELGGEFAPTVDDAATIGEQLGAIEDDLARAQDRGALEAVVRRGLGVYGIRPETSADLARALGRPLGPNAVDLLAPMSSPDTRTPLSGKPPLSSRTLSPSSASA